MADLATAAPAVAPVEPGRGRLVVAAVWVFVGVVFVIALVATGSPLRDVALWLVTVLLGVLLPGIVVVRAVRPVTCRRPATR
jgi:hypothetical protein